MKIKKRLQRYPYQIEHVNGHNYYYFPPGSSLLSIPFVASFNCLGYSTMTDDQQLNEDGEEMMQKYIAAFLMSMLSCFIFSMCTFRLTIFPSVLITLWAAFGTQIYSTASRALWSHTWGVFLYGFAIFHLAMAAKQNREPKIWLFGSLCGLMYITRPTFAAAIAGILVYVGLRHGRSLLSLSMTLLLWLGAFMTFSFIEYEQILPNYYFVRDISPGTFVNAFLGHLVSPSRGLFIFTPITVVLLGMSIRYWKHLRKEPFFWLAYSTIVLHLFVISSVRFWWGGNSYGARLTTDLVPTFVVLAILCFSQYFMHERKTDIGSRIFEGTVVLLIILSIAVNAIGAISAKSWYWNVDPRPIRFDEERVWDWSNPQFWPARVSSKANVGK